jgi:peptidoglycan pentaglycine glycine transferase (the first glycine)
MQLVEVLESQKATYNNFVATAESGSFLQSWEWGQWQKNLGRETYRFFLTDNSEITGAIQLIKMPLPFGKYYLYAPYGPVVGGKLEILNSKLETIFKELKFKFPDAVFFRFEFKGFSDFVFRASDLSFKKTLNIQPAKTLIIDLNKSEEQLLADMHHKTRYNIRVAQKHGVEIKDEFSVSIGNGLFAKEAVALIFQTSKRQGYKGYGIDYYEKMIDALAIKNVSLGLKLHIYKAIYNSKLLASAIMIDFGKTRTFLFGGSADENKNVMAPYLLHYKAMLDAKTLGLNFYDFWGVETSKGEVPGFVRFKLGFGGIVKQYAGAYDSFSKSLSYGLYKIFRKIKRFI